MVICGKYKKFSEIRKCNLSYQKLADFIFLLFFTVQNTPKSDMLFKKKGKDQRVIFCAKFEKKDSIIENDFRPEGTLMP